MANSGGAGPTPGGSQNKYGVTATTLLRSGQSVLFRVSVTVAGSAAGAAYDSNSTSSLNNQIGAIPSAVGVYEFIWPCSTGIVVVPPTGGTISVSYE